MSSKAFAEYLQEKYPGCVLAEISSTNSLVYLVHTQDGPLVAKHVLDKDVPLNYSAAVNRHLSRCLPVQEVLEIYEVEAGDHFDAVIARHVEGVDVASLLTSGAEALDMAGLVTYLARFVDACDELPRLHSGFAMFKRNAPIFDQHIDWITHYGNRYWKRARPFFAESPVAEAVDEWLDSGFSEAAGQAGSVYQAVPVDANLKNFIVTDAGEFVVLNVPIIAVSTRSHAIGAISAHLRNRPAHAAFLELATSSLDPRQRDLVAHYELWLLLGILSFYADREPDRPEHWRDWGAPVPLRTDFENLARTLLLQGER
jgi:hypothetical protein